MNKYWVAVANSSELKIFASNNSIYKIDSDLSFIEELKHNESRLKANELDMDRHGRYKGYESNSSAYEPINNAKEIQKMHFADEVNSFLIKAKNENRFDQLILIAPEHFYGILNAYMNHHLKDSITKVIQKDYTMFTTDKLAKMITKE